MGYHISITVASHTLAGALVGGRLEMVSPQEGRERMDPLTREKVRHVGRRGAERTSRCDVCARKLRAPGLLLEEAGQGSEPEQSWMLCRGCYDDVQREIQRAGLRSPLRVRVAVGVVASQRGQRDTSWFERLGEQAWERLIIGLVLLTFFVHGIVFILITILVARPR